MVRQESAECFIQSRSRRFAASQPHSCPDFAEGAAEEVLDRLIELNAEEAALAADVPDAIDRLERIRKRLNEIDPYYTFSVSVGPEGRTVD